MATEIERKEKGKGRGITFKCKYCQRSRPLDEMAVLTRFFPPVIVCRDCEKKIR